MPRTPRLLLTGLATMFLAAPGWSAQPDPAHGNVSRIWMMNIGSEAAEVRVERSLNGTESDETLTVGPAEVAEVRRSAGEEVRFQEQRDLLIVTASPAFDPSAIRVAGSPAGAGIGRRHEAVRTTGKAPAGGWLKKGESASAQGVWTAAEARTVRLGLRGKSMAEVRLKRHDGEFLGYVTVSADRPVEVTIDFGPLLDASRYWGVVRREITVHQGQVAQLDSQPGEMRNAIAASGTGVFSDPINWELTPPLYYYVSGGPANTCGESNVQRNGTWHFSANWLCTDGSGNATKGPWYWSNQTADERAVAFIRWPNNTTTSTDEHIWDVTCPTINIDYWLFPPYGWGGWANDGTNGACFGSYSRIYSTFQSLTTGQYWQGTSYSSGSASKHYSSGPSAGSCYWSWGTSYPSSTAHTSGHQYRWKVCVQENIYESNCEVCETYDFTW